MDEQSNIEANDRYYGPDEHHATKKKSIERKYDAGRNRFSSRLRENSDSNFAD